MLELVKQYLGDTPILLPTTSVTPQGLGHLLNGSDKAVLRPISERLAILFDDAVVTSEWNANVDFPRLAQHARFILFTALDASIPQASTEIAVRRLDASTTQLLRARSTRLERLLDDKEYEAALSIHHALHVVDRIEQVSLRRLGETFSHADRLFERYRQAAEASGSELYRLAFIRACLFAVYTNNALEFSDRDVRELFEPVLRELLPNATRDDALVDDAISWATTPIDSGWSLILRLGSGIYRFPDAIVSRIAKEWVPRGLVARALDDDHRKVNLAAYLLLNSHHTEALAVVDSVEDELQPQTLLVRAYVLEAMGDANAYDTFVAAAEQGSAGAMTWLGYNAQDRHDSEGARSWWQRAAEQGSAEAQFNLGKLASDAGDTATAISLYESATEAGDLSAPLALGLLYSNLGETDKAIATLRRPSLRDNPGAMVNTGVVLAHAGRVEEAQTFYRMAASAEEPRGMFNLGVSLYEEGYPEEGRQWLLRAAEAGEFGAFNNLGIICIESGSDEDALDYWNRGADVGDLYCIHALASYYIDRDLTLAIAWAERAAAVGFPLSMHLLGELLISDGRLGDAESWLRQAVVAGENGALIGLTVLAGAAGDHGGVVSYLLKLVSLDQKVHAFTIDEEAALADALVAVADRQESDSIVRDLAMRGYTAARLALARATFASDPSAAEAMIRAEAEGGSETAIMDLARVLWVQSRVTDSEGWLRKAAATGDAEATVMLAVLLREDEFRRPEAKVVLEEHAWREQPDVVLTLAMYLYEEQDLDNALRLLRFASDCGSLEATSELGAILSEQGDTEGARQWMTDAADGGHVGAMFNLGLLESEHGRTDRALEWYHRAADMGSWQAMIQLASGNGDSDPDLAWLQRAAKTGAPMAMLRYGNALSISGSRESALEWWKRAADAGNEDAVLNVAQELGLNGEFEEALALCKTADLKANSRAMTMAARLCVSLKRYEEAETWFHRAARSGDEFAKDALVKMLNFTGRYREAAEIEGQRLPRLDSAGSGEK